MSFSRRIWLDQWWNEEMKGQRWLKTTQTHMQKHINHGHSHTDTWWDELMEVDGNIWEMNHSCSLQLSLSQLLHTVDEQKPSAAYSTMSPVSSLPVRFDSPTMHNCITHHHTSLFNTALSPFSRCKVWLKISSADGGRDCVVVISAGLYTFVFPPALFLHCSQV